MPSASTGAKIFGFDLELDGFLERPPPTDKGSFAPLARQQFFLAQVRQRLANGDDADPELTGELNFPGNAIAIAPCS